MSDFECIPADEWPSLGIGAAIVIGVLFSALIFGVGAGVGYLVAVNPAGAELNAADGQMTEHTAYTLGVAEGARLEALKHCPCDTKRYLGAPCPPSKVGP